MTYHQMSGIDYHRITLTNSGEFLVLGVDTIQGMLPHNEDNITLTSMIKNKGLIRLFALFLLWTHTVTLSPSPHSPHPVSV